MACDNLRAIVDIHAKIVWKRFCLECDRTVGGGGDDPPFNGIGAVLGDRLLNAPEDLEIIPDLLEQILEGRRIDLSARLDAQFDGPGHPKALARKGFTYTALQ